MDIVGGVVGYEVVDACKHLLLLAVKVSSSFGTQTNYGGGTSHPFPSLPSHPLPPPPTQVLYSLQIAKVVVGVVVTDGVVLVYIVPNYT